MYAVLWIQRYIVQCRWHPIISRGQLMSFARGQLTIQVNSLLSSKVPGAPYFPVGGGSMQMQPVNAQ